MSHSAASSQSLPSLAVILDSAETLMYDRNRDLPEKQVEYLHVMDGRMDLGFMLSGESILEPGIMERAQFVSLQLIDSLGCGEDGLAAACCAWLATRLPDLKQLKSQTTPQGYKIEFVFDRDIETSRQEQTMVFHPTVAR